MDDAKFRQLVDQMRAGDTNAMGSLLVAGFTPLRSVIARHMGDLLAKAGVEPEDVIQEAYAAAWSNLPDAQFDNFEAFVGWLRQIAENKLIDIQRAATADKRDVRRQAAAWGVQSGTYVNLLDRVSSPMATPSRGAAHSEAVAVLMVRLLQLPEDYRQVIHWRLIDGLSVAEVAKRLDRSEAAVHMLCHRALKQLRELMGAASNYLTQT
ncbi:MAG TPA: sigma-70 family RNA polymerase sigma factor [Phycisphaerae bacterium]|nr:sigma-70 family RNA polymerase sigma factor [Phycisphaerae bacterium]HOJ72440.1 sigma-70 family RNA polymerase sigma factor [Phycisphaerae bacterium]HOM49898.1 sigma-70 family RNA polymerase sigma factor [Phycisphaerae bacterium]HON67290.1 sigma-70 family RNA polymerase sigma factor [Phycisphaerae bacterium]HOQ84688.1 sigma-70 family RNA polymerase sigma factor [Phycisphaerae bacterium]